MQLKDSFISVLKIFQYKSSYELDEARQHIIALFLYDPL